MPCLHQNGIAIDGNVIAIRIDLHAKFFDDLSIHRYFAASDQLIGFASRCNSGRGNETIEADSFFFIRPLGDDCFADRFDSNGKSVCL